MRRLLPFAVALVVYVVLGVVLKSFFLNWIVGPLFLLLALDVIPRALGRRPLFTLPVEAPVEDTTIS
jgi:hypothetical protein